MPKINYLFQVVGKDPKQSDRFYSAFYRKLLDPQIGTANKRAVFLNLLYRVLRTDQSILRLHAFLKRILQVSIYFPANMICATLYVVSQVLHSRKFANKILLRSNAVVKHDDTIDLNDTINETVKKKEIRTKENNKETENTIVLSNVVTEDITGTNSCDKSDEKPEVVEIKSEFKATYYDPFTRNPLHSGANLIFYSELIALSTHYHPSVSLFANTIKEGKIAAFFIKYTHYFI